MTSTSRATEETMIVDLILDSILKHLEENLKDNVADDDKTKVDVVKKGLIVSEKTTKNIQLGIQGGDHEDPTIQDGIISLEKHPEVAMYYPAREIGGGEVWVRRGVVKIECFFVVERLSEADAFRVAYNVLGRLVHYLRTVPVSNLVDSFGERALTMHPYASTFHQSGGPPANYIFRGKVDWMCFTGKTYEM